MIIRDPEHTYDTITPGTTQLVGMGLGQWGELWGHVNDNIPTLQPLGGYDDDESDDSTGTRTSNNDNDNDNDNDRVVVDDTIEEEEENTVTTADLQQNSSENREGNGDNEGDNDNDDNDENEGDNDDIGDDDGFQKLNLPQMKTEDQIQIKQIACGSLHMIMLDFSGRCWALGDNDEGQLGIGCTHKTRRPTLITGGDIGNEFIEQIGTGGWFSAFITRTGHVLTCGNIYRMFLQDIVGNVDTVRKGTEYVPRIATTHARNAPPGPNDQRHHFHKLACGNRFLLVQDKWTRQVYGLGTDDGNALSTTEMDNRILTPVYYRDSESGQKQPLNICCKKLDAGERFSVVLDHQGALFITGHGYDREKAILSLVRELFDRGVRLIDVCCSWAQFIGLDMNGCAHLGVKPDIHGTTVVQLNFFGPVLQIGTGNVQLYARTNNHIYKFMEQENVGKAENEQSSVIHPARCSVLEYASGFHVGDRDFVQMTGSYFTTVIHLAQLRPLSTDLLRQNLHQFAQNRRMCDLVLTFNEDKYD